MQRINSVARGPGGSAGSASQDGGEAAVRAAQLSCRAGAGRGRGHPDGAAEQQVTWSLLGEWPAKATAWLTGLSPGWLCFYA